MSEQIIYNNVDISGSVETEEAVHDMYAGCEQADTLTLTFEDEGADWDAWGAVPGDTVVYKNGGTSTGTMYVHSVYPENGFFTVRAASIPQNAKLCHTKSWESVHLLQVGSEVAGRFGFSFRIEGMENFYYDYIAQENEPDIAFLNRIAKLEGGILIVYNNEVILYGEEALEKRETDLEVTTGDGTFSGCDRSGDIFGKAKLSAGSCYGVFTADPSNSRTLDIKGRATSDAEAKRWARGLLRQANKNGRTCRLQKDIMREFSAGITVDLDNQAAPKWSGKMFLYHVRHEYKKERTTLFMRPPLEGY